MKKTKRKNKTELKTKKHASGDRKRPPFRVGKKAYILGVDEVGRGPLAGPVTVCVSLLAQNSDRRLKKELKRISGRPYPIGKDSKKMTETEREFWFEYLKVFEQLGDVQFFVGSKSAAEIDKKGIAVCIHELVDSLISRASLKMNANFKMFTLLADAGLKTKHGVAKQKSIVKGDEKEFVISIASVYAKVTRDRYMSKLAKKKIYEKYKFDINKGYGTEFHRKSIRKFGLSDQHRKGFCGRLTG